MSSNVSSNFQRRLFQGQQIKEETTYQYDTIINEVNGDVTVRDIGALVLVINPDSAESINLPQIRELLQSPNGSFRIIDKRRKVVRTTSGEGSETGESNERVVEDTVVPDSGDIVDPDEIIQALDDGTKITLAELGEVKTYVSEEDGKTHVSFILKVVQSKEMRPIIRINKVVILIIMFLGVATLVFILFFIYVLRGQG